MSTRLITLAFEQFINDLKALLEMEAEQIKLFAGVVNDEKGFGIGNEAKFFEFLETTGLSIDKVEKAGKAGKFIFNHEVKSNLSAEDVIEQIEEVCEKFNLGKIGSKKEALKLLFQIHDEYILRARASGYINSGVPLLDSISINEDLRVIWNKEKTKKLALVPMCLVRMHAKDQNDKEESFIFQVPINGLEQLIQKLGDACKSLKSLSPAELAGLSFYSPEVSKDDEPEKEGANGKQ